MAGLGDLAKNLKGFKQKAPNVVVRAAEKVVEDLQDKGPYWTGEFFESWDITLNKENASARQTVAIISNGAPHALIAMDLIPGRWGEGKNNTAPQDWYLTYINGGELDRTVKSIASNLFAQAFSIVP